MNLNSGETASSVMPFSRHAMISAPKRTPRTVPRPPFRLTPPMTHASDSGDVAATNSEAVCRIGDRDGYDEGDQHYAGNRSRTKNQQIERGPICFPDHVRKLTG